MRGSKRKPSHRCAPGVASGGSSRALARERRDAPHRTEFEREASSERRYKLTFFSLSLFSLLSDGNRLFSSHSQRFVPLARRSLPQRHCRHSCCQAPEAEKEKRKAALPTSDDGQSNDDGCRRRKCCCRKSVPSPFSRRRPLPRLDVLPRDGSSAGARRRARRGVEPRVRLREAARRYENGIWLDCFCFLSLSRRLLPLSL